MQVISPATAIDDLYGRKSNNMLNTINQTLTTIHPTFQPGYSYTEKTSVIKKFIAWTKTQEDSRFFWLALTLFGHGCVITPLTVFVVLITGVNLTLFMCAVTSMAMTMVVNLAALPTKITIPVLLFSLVIDIIVVACALTLGFAS